MDRNKKISSDHFMRSRRKSLFGPLQLIHLLVALLIISLVGFLFFTTQLARLENNFLDLFFKYRTPPKVSSKIIIVPIDQGSLESLGSLPWPRHYYAEMINLLTEWKVRAVVFEDSFQDEAVYEEDAKLEAVFAQNKNIYLPLELKSKKEKKIWVHSLPILIKPRGEGLEWVHSTEELEAVAQSAGHKNVVIDRDGVVRRAPLFLAGADLMYPSLTLPLAYELLGEPLPGSYTHSLPVDSSGNLVINWLGAWQDVFEVFSYGDLIRSAQAIKMNQQPIIDLPKLEGKVVFLGVSADGMSEKNITPMGVNYPDFAIQATIFNSLLTKQYIRPLSLQQALLFLLGIGLCSTFLFIFLRGISALVIAGFISAGWISMAFVLFWKAGIPLPIFHGLLIVLLLYVFSAVFHQMVSSEETTRLFDLATRDGLTGLYVIRHFREILNRVVEQSEITNEPVTVILMDIDNFKPVNDTYGHPAGDAVLKKTAEIIFSCLRSRRKEDEVDYVGRYGGEEFIVLLPKTSLDLTSKKIAERIREAIQREEFKWQGHLIPVTVSIGVSELKAGEKVPDAMVHRADEALYEAKRTGKNRVCFK